MTEPYMPDMRGWSEEDRQLWERADPQERLRSMMSVADLVREDMHDPETPSTFAIALKSEEEEEEADDDGRGRLAVASSSVATNMRRVRDLLRSWGWTVVESAGWETRGVRVLSPSYIGAHHTGAEVDIDRILRDGRSDLKGPLCNFAVHLDGAIILMAAGTANHFGVATINNDEAYGIECTGPIPLSAKGRKAFPMYKAYIALCVAIRIVHGWPVTRIVGHKETARPDGRKPDPAFEEGQPGDGYPSPYPEMSRFRTACNIRKVLRTEEEDLATIPDSEWDEVLRAARQINGAVSPGQSSAEGTLEAILPSIQSVFNAVGKLTAMVQASADVTGDDETNIIARVDAARAELKAAEEHLASLVSAPPAPTT